MKNLRQAVEQLENAIERRTTRRRNKWPKIEIRLEAVNRECPQCGKTVLINETCDHKPYGDDTTDA